MNSGFIFYPLRADYMNNSIKFVYFWQVSLIISKMTLLWSTTLVLSFAFLNFPKPFSYFLPHLFSFSRRLPGFRKTALSFVGRVSISLLITSIFFFDIDPLKFRIFPLHLLGYQLFIFLCILVQIFQ
jgi:hypothetical protein